MRDRAESFREIAENSSEVFWLIDVDSRKVLYVSPACEAIWGRPRDTLYEDPQSFFTTIHPEDQRRVADVMEAHRESGFEVEYRIVRPDGSFRWIRNRGFPVRDERGRVDRLAGIAEDITRRKSAADAVKQAEDRFRLIIDTIPTMVWGMGADGVMDFINQRWLSYTGFSREQAMEDSMSAVHPDDRQRAMDKWMIDQAAGVSSEDELRLRRADGEYRWFLIRTVPLRDDQGRIVNWFGTSTDIEDRKQAEENLSASSEQLRALSGRLQSAREEEGIRIAREIHDELGGSLASLRWDLEGVKKAILESGKMSADGEVAEKLEAMFALTDTMITVVRRIASNLRPVILDVLGLEEAIEWQAREFQDRTGIAAHCELSGSGIRLDPAQSTAVFRIFQEALTNVLRHARATRVDVTAVENNGAFVLKIGDNGRGITESERTGAFSIGLLGMRERAHFIGGELDVTGIEGKGTTVTVHVPLRKAGG